MAARLVTAVAMLLLSVPGISAEIDGNIDLGATVTDNLYQDMDAGEDEVILRLEPTLSFAHE
jgi:hypothetical protein